MISQDAPPTAAGRRAEVPKRRFLGPLGGPLLIVAAVVIVAHNVAFGGLVSVPSPDMLPLWLPNHCLLGTSLAHGHIPLWNPHVMAGAPFAADPQSGWMYLPVMVLYPALSCDGALRAFIVLQPVLSGLGMYWFLRSERLPRPAATLGGLALALPLAGSSILQNLPIMGTIAWTALSLAAASRYLRATTWSGRLGWLAAMAVAWGQVAAAFLSNGLVLGTGAILAFLVVAIARDVRARTRALRPALLVGALPLLAFALGNAAYLLPRIAYLPHTNLGLGYVRLEELSQRLTGLPSAGHALFTGTPLRSTWPAWLATSPGAYVGLLVLVLSFVGLTSKRRSLSVSFALYGAVCYLASLDSVARVASHVVASKWLAGLWLHEPSRFLFGVFVAVAVLAALGVESWMQMRERRRRIVLGAAVAMWGVVPLIVDHRLSTHLLPAFGAVAAAGGLWLVLRDRRFLAVLPALLAVELCVNGLANDSRSAALVPASARAHTRPVPLRPLRPNMYPIAAYVRPGAIATELQARAGDTRYATVAPGSWDTLSAYHRHQLPAFQGLLGMQQSMLFGLQEAQGYNSVQLLRFWEFDRAVDRRMVRYNDSYLEHGSPTALNLLQVGWVIGQSGDPPVPGATPVAEEGAWSLFPVADPAPHAGAYTSWQNAESPGRALALVTGASFDPARDVVLEGPPVPAGNAAAEPAPASPVTYRWDDEQAATVIVDAPAPAVVLIRNSWDRNWRATVDGVPAPVLHADFFLQGIRVSAGHHVIRLEYHDPTVLAGLGISVATLAGLLIASVWLRVRRRTPAPREGRATPEAPGASPAVGGGSESAAEPPPNEGSDPP